MRKLNSLYAAGAVALALVSASAANAATDLGTVGDSSWTLNSDSSYSESLKGAATSGIGTQNVYTFTLSTPANFYDVSVTGNTLKGGGSVAGYTFSLTGPSYVMTGASTGKMGELTDGVTMLAAGTYTLDITAISTAKGATFGGTIDVSPVPIPAALPLFGSALAGFGIFGARRRRKAALSA